MSHITLIPAYGRDYKSRAEIVKDLAAGRDFNAQHPVVSGYCNAEQLIQAGLFDVNVRYKQLRSVCVIDLRKLEAELAKANKPKAPRKSRAKAEPDFDSLEDEIEALMPEIKI